MKRSRRLAPYIRALPQGTVRQVSAGMSHPVNDPSAELGR
jgi:hypothetical protein